MIKEMIWFTEFMSSKPIGIIIVDNDIDGAHAFIGTGHGLNERDDAELILEHGAKLHLHTVEVIESLLRDLKRGR